MEERPATKLLGGQVREDLYWAFRKKAAERHEQMSEAIENAALLYLECDSERGETDEPTE